MKYTVKNKRYNQDNINFYDVKNAREEISSFLDYNEILEYSLETGNILKEKNIASICDGGDHLSSYFSENSAAFECENFVESSPFSIFNEKTGEWIEKTLKFSPEISEYELF